MMPYIYIACIQAALVMASLDALLIALDKRIGHTLRATVRVLLGVAFIVAVAMLTSTGFWRLAAMLLGAGAAFSFAFRWALNGLRAKPAIYLAEGNWYDRQWLARFGPKMAGHYVYLAEAVVATIVAAIYTLFPTPPTPPIP